MPVNSGSTLRMCAARGISLTSETTDRRIIQRPCPPTPPSCFQKKQNLRRFIEKKAYHEKKSGETGMRKNSGTPSSMWGNCSGVAPWKHNMGQAAPACERALGLRTSNTTDSTACAGGVEERKNKIHRRHSGSTRWREGVNRAYFAPALLRGRKARTVE